jgi:hypothetical protein
MKRDKDHGKGFTAMRSGRIERTSKSRTYVAPKRPDLSECKVTYTDDGVRTVTPPNRNPTKVVRWKGKKYYVPANIAG